MYKVKVSAMQKSTAVEEMASIYKTFLQAHILRYP